METFAAWSVVMAAVLGLAALVLLCHRQSRRLDHIPGPPRLPLLGNLPEIMKLGMPVFSQQCARMYGPIFKIWLGRRPIVVLAGAEEIRSAGTRLAARVQLPRSLSRGLDLEVEKTALTLVRGDQWRTLRAAWQPAFHTSALDSYLGLMNRNALKLLGRLAEPAASGTPVDMWQEVGKMTLAVVGEAAYGVDFGTLPDDGIAAVPQRGADVMGETQRNLGPSLTGTAPSPLPAPQMASATASPASPASSATETSSQSPPSPPAVASIIGDTAAAPTAHTTASTGPIANVGSSAQAGHLQVSSCANGTGLTTSDGSGVVVKPTGVPVSTSTGTATTAAAATTSAQAAAAPAAEPAVDGVELVEACKTFFSLAVFARSSVWSRANLLFPELNRLWSSLAYAVPDRRFLQGLQARRIVRATSMRMIQQHCRPAGADTDATTAPSSQQGQPVGHMTAGGFVELIHGARHKTDGRPLTDAEVIGQANVFMLAGYDTTANALSFAIYNVASNPPAQQRLLQEVDAFGRDRDVCAEDIDQAFPYAHAILSETLRLYPSAPATTRDVEADMNVGGHVVPAGTTISLSFYSLHHDPDVWPEPERFIPERFLQDAGGPYAARVPGAHLPFGLGRRMCIGLRFATREAVVALVRLYQRYMFELLPGQVPLAVVSGVTMSPKAGVWVTVSKRQ